MGEGSVAIDTELKASADSDYVDAQIFTYKPKHADGKVKKVNITVALIASGADGCTRAKPISPASCFNLTLGYLHAAGKMGVDLAVLPENWWVGLDNFF